MNYQTELLDKHRRNIQFRFNTAYILVFVLALFVYSKISLEVEKEYAMELVTQTINNETTIYFDSLITMMLTGTMQHKDILRKNMLSKENVIDARLIRNPQFFATISEEQKPQDGLEEQALESNGESVVALDQKLNILSVAVPLKVTTSTRGVNCLQCHKEHSSQTLGVIRIDYALENSEKRTLNKFYNDIVILILIFLASLLVANLYVSRHKE